MANHYEMRPEWFSAELLDLRLLKCAASLISKYLSFLWNKTKKKNLVIDYQLR